MSSHTNMTQGPGLKTNTLLQLQHFCAKSIILYNDCDITDLIASRCKDGTIVCIVWLRSGTFSYDAELFVRCNMPLFGRSGLVWCHASTAVIRLSGRSVHTMATNKL